ncbi:MAG: hypothetical protein PWQ96_2205 [Clostridia bacterium]|nr:hypothetical protein [Clostridia bacterium]
MQLGEQIKKIRKQRGLTLQQLADMTDFSIGFLSNIERDITSPTVSSLQKICEVLNVNMVELIQPSEDKKIVVRKHQRRELYKSSESKVKYELVTEGNRKIQGVCITMEPGANYGDESRGHSKDELGIVLQGTLEIVLDDKTYILNEGDSIYIEANHPHRYRNIGKDQCICFFVLS